MLKTTPLYEEYSGLTGVKLIEFGGWRMPVDFGTGIVAEHRAVRERAGIFDVSHMGEILVSGPGARDFLQYLLTNDVEPLEPGHALYSPMCYPDGGVVDDLLVYMLEEARYLLVVNASNTVKDYRWIVSGCPWTGDRSRAVVEDVSAAYIQIAVQGPMALDLLKSLTDHPLDRIGYYRFDADVEIAGRAVLISRTGYTGEDGFEIYAGPEAGRSLWRALTEGGRERGIIPCGLGARDTLRLEARLPLYGHELSAEISPLEAGLKPFVKLRKPDFCGKSGIEERRAAGRVLRGCMMIDPGVPRGGYAVSKHGVPIGTVTSGGKSPSLDAFIALVLVIRGMVGIGDEVEIDIRGTLRKARIVETPFYRKD